MRTSMKVMLAAMGAAVGAYPVMADTLRNGYVQPDLSTNNVFWGMRYAAYRRHPAYEHPAYGGHGYGYVAHPPAGHPYGYGPVVHLPAGRLAPGGTVEGVNNPPNVDCIHVLFPQCGDGG
jgi:hypothetical protein